MSERAPVRVKLYGFLPMMLRRRYVFQLVVAGGLGFGLLVAWWLRWPTLREELRTARTATMDRLIAFWDIAPWLIIAFAALQVVEAWYVFGLFEKKEKEAAATPAAPTVAEEPKSSAPG